MANPVPLPIIAAVSDVLGNRFSAEELDALFIYAGIRIAPPQEFHEKRCKAWLVSCNNSNKINAISTLGSILEVFMEKELQEPESDYDQYFHNEIVRQRNYLSKALSNHGLTYMPGGRIIKTDGSLPTKTLEQMLRGRDFPSVEQEFQRAMDNAATDPATAITAACAIIEALCKAYIHDHGLEPPKDKSVSPLWQVVKKHLNLDPKSLVDQDLRKILQGLGSVVEGLGALRTHIGNAHGQDKTPYTVHPRHARLAINAAHTLAVFVMERWDIKDESSSAIPVE